MPLPCSRTFCGSPLPQVDASTLRSLEPGSALTTRAHPTRTSCL